MFLCIEQRLVPYIGVANIEDFSYFLHFWSKLWVEVVEVFLRRRNPYFRVRCSVIQRCGQFTLISWMMDHSVIFSWLLSRRKTKLYYAVKCVKNTESHSKIFSSALNHHSSNDDDSERTVTCLLIISGSGDSVISVTPAAWNCFSISNKKIITFDWAWLSGTLGCERWATQVLPSVKLYRLGHSSVFVSSSVSYNTVSILFVLQGLRSRLNLQTGPNAIPTLAFPSNVANWFFPTPTPFLLHPFISEQTITYSWYILSELLLGVLEIVPLVSNLCQPKSILQAI